MPSLDLAALKQHIAERRLRPLYLLVGEDLKLLDRMVDAIEASVDPADRPFAVERRYAGDPGGSAIDVASSARMLPMLGDRRIVVVLRAERWLKPRRAAKSGSAADEEAGDRAADEPLEAAAIEDYLEAPLPSSTLVFVATDVDRTRRLTKRLLEKALVVEFRGLGSDLPGERTGGPSASAWLQDEIARAGRAIDSDAARLLAARSGHDVTKLRGDVERLLLFTEGRQRISADDVLEVVMEADTVSDEWGVINAIANGDAARALAETGRRLERGDSPHALVGQLRWWVSSRLSEADPARVKGALEALLRTDLALKSSGGDERVLVERLVAELTGRPLPPRGWSGRH